MVSRFRSIAWKSLLVVFLIFLSSLQSAVLAVTKQDLNWPWYLMTGNGQCTGSSSLVGGSNEDKIWNYLRSKGLSEVATAAIMGNMKFESGFEPRKNNGGELSDWPVSRYKAYGIVQWMDQQGDSGGRQTNLVNKAKKANVIAGDLGIQLDYTWDELSNGFKTTVTDKINASGISLPDATKIVYDWYEGLYNSGDTSLGTRQGYAQDIYNAHKGSAAGGGSSGCVCSPVSPTSTPGNTAKANGNLDLAAVVSKYGLQSVIVKQVGGSVVGAVNADQAPDRTASVLKLIIAHAFLSKDPNLSKQVTIKASQDYGSGDPVFHVGQTVSLQEVLTNTLNINSSNIGANVLVDETGGLSATNSTAHSLGYSQTSIVAYYHDPPSAINKSTVTDLTKALETIYTTSGSGYQIAKDALNENYFNISPAPEAAKWGMNAYVTGNAGLFNVNGTKYIITLYINKTGQNSQIKGATEDILAQLNGGAPPSASGAPGTGCSGGIAGMMSTILGYAWPSPHTPPLEMTPAYATATQVAQANGEYVGGPPPGIDCGGFVTRVMINSGADPGYNYGGKLSAGAGNTVQQQKYLEEGVKSGKYTKITPGSVSDLQQGDIAIKNSGTAHTFIYVGQLAGFNGNIASSSLSEKAPAAATVGLSYLQEFEWYRLSQ